MRAVEEAATHQKRPALRCVCGVGDGDAAPIDEPVQRGRRAAKDWPEDRVEGKLRRQGLYERRREEEVVRRDRRGRSLRGPSAQRDFRAGESDEHSSTRGGSYRPTSSGVEGCAPPSWTLAKAAAVARQMCAHPRRMAANNAGAGASRPR